ncbi:Uncharacterised protein [Streptococcus pneumoniae]|nr:Uncharacterised protein [Streptococcus pneumoniae]
MVFRFGVNNWGLNFQVENFLINMIEFLKVILPMVEMALLGKVENI